MEFDGPSAATPPWPDDLPVHRLPPAHELRTQQLADPFSAGVIRYIEGGATGLSRADAKVIRARASHFVVRDGVLYRCGDLFDDGLSVQHRIVIPASLQEAVTTTAHGGTLGSHIGMDKLSGVLRRRYFWLGMQRTARKVIRLCMRCAANKTKLAAATALRRPMVAARPFYHVHIDLWQPGVVSAAGHKYVLTVVDRLTHWPEMIPLKDKHASTVADAFFSHVLCRHGVPAYVTSDNGTEFEGEFDALTRKYGVSRIRTSPHHPQANGIVERLHGFMRGSIAAMSSADQAQWHRLLPATTLTYRSAPVARIGCTPFFLMHGREPVLPGELRAVAGAQTPVDADVYVADMRRLLKYENRLLLQQAR